MGEKTTILISKDTVKLLQKAKQHPRQTYDDLLKAMAHAVLDTKRTTQYDQFLHEIQKQKMRELWENPDDEAWDKI